MNKTFLKRLTEAHSWLGLIISGLLFIVFFAGAVSLFKEELHQWSFQPHFEVAQGEQLPLSKVIGIAIDGLPFDAKEHLTIISPNKHNPYYLAYVDVTNKSGDEHYVSRMIDPVSGNIVSSVDKFSLADFIYRLHFDLRIPAGDYIIGFVTLFFFFALATGIIIHARKLVSNFFKYRTEQTQRSQLLDMHNVVGVMTLPLTVMYALSGLIFNLIIIYQIAFAVVLYKGDQQALLDDAGYQLIAPKWQDKVWQAPKIDELVNKVKTDYGYGPTIYRFYNYGDESAMVQMRGFRSQEFNEEYDVTYHVKNHELAYVKDRENPNALVQGLRVMAKLHFGDFAGLDLRLVYFFLSVGVCALIITGNMLWIDKKVRQRTSTPKSIQFVSIFTLWSSGGFILATAVAVFVERVLPIAWEQRADYMVWSFVATLIITAVSLLKVKQGKQFLATVFNISAFLLILVVIADWLLHASMIITHTSNGIASIIGVEIGLLLLASLFTYSAKKLTHSDQTASPSSAEYDKADFQPQA